MSEVEQSILRKLVESEIPERLPEIDRLVVVARCGCGACPTVLLSAEPFGQALTGKHKELASYRGINAEGVEVGVILLERKGKIAELEAWSPHGESIFSWPAPSALRRFQW